MNWETRTISGMRCYMLHSDMGIRLAEVFTKPANPSVWMYYIRRPAQSWLLIDIHSQPTEQTLEAVADVVAEFWA